MGQMQKKKKDPDGKYGLISITFMGVSQTLDMHRAAYMAYHGELNLQNVWHICHEELCVNPKHLSHKDHKHQVKVVVDGLQRDVLLIWTHVVVMLFKGVIFWIELKCQLRAPDYM